METKLERIAAKSLSEPNLVFTSIAHHVTKELMWDSLNHMWGLVNIWGKSQL